MSNSQLNKLKSGKNSSEVTLNLSPDVIGDSNDQANFPQKLWLTIINYYKPFWIIHHLIQSYQKWNCSKWDNQEYFNHDF